MQKIQMNFEGNRGYVANQVGSITLEDLAGMVEQAIADFGEDAEVVLHQTNNGCGANFGSVYPDLAFQPVGDDEDEYY